MWRLEGQDITMNVTRFTIVIIIATSAMIIVSAMRKNLIRKANEGLIQLIVIIKQNK